MPRVARSAHSSHRLYFGGGRIARCARCGAFGAQRSQFVRAVCLGRPRNKDACQSLRKLRRDVDPSSGREFGRSEPLSSVC
eukprot:7662206-Pyramimonas_sp.AAC.1